MSNWNRWIQDSTGKGYPNWKEGTRLLPAKSGYAGRRRLQRYNNCRLERSSFPFSLYCFLFLFLPLFSLSLSSYLLFLILLLVFVSLSPSLCLCTHESFKHRSNRAFQDRPHESPQREAKTANINKRRIFCFPPHVDPAKVQQRLRERSCEAVRAAGRAWSAPNMLPSESGVAMHVVRPRDEGPHARGPCFLNSGHTPVLVICFKHFPCFSRTMPMYLLYIYIYVYTHH